MYLRHMHPQFWKIVRVFRVIWYGTGCVLCLCTCLLGFFLCLHPRQFANVRTVAVSGILPEIPAVSSSLGSQSVVIRLKAYPQHVFMITGAAFDVSRYDMITTTIHAGDTVRLLTDSTELATNTLGEQLVGVYGFSKGAMWYLNPENYYKVVVKRYRLTGIACILVGGLLFAALAAHTRSICFTPPHNPYL